MKQGKLRILSVLAAVMMVLPFVAELKVSARLSVLKVPHDYATIQDAVDAAMPRDEIVVEPGDWFGAEVWKPLEILGEDGAIITDGPQSTSGLKFGFWIEGSGWADGTRISGFTFKVDYPIYGLNVTDVTIDHNVMFSPYWGISNMGGSRWTITYNDITGLTDYPDRTWGSHGILLVSGNTSAPADHNLVAFNKISGDYSGYRPSAGILLEVDANPTDAGEVKFNKVTHNKVETIDRSPNQLAAAIALFFLDAGSGKDPTNLLRDNTVSFNDLRGSTIELFFFPPNLEGCNTIFGNLGKNRGHE